jgi:hypothetical protein
VSISYKRTVKYRVSSVLCINSLDDMSLWSVTLFAGTWLVLGNLWSLVFSFRPITITTQITVIFSIIYLLATIPVILSFFAELSRIKSKLKWIIFSEVLIFVPFIIAPPRNGDAMRVWLAKIYDVWMNGEKVVRPYWHYNLPDAFTLFHLPMINLWDGQIFQLSIWTALCAVIIMLIKIGRAYCTEKVMMIGIALFLFNPLIILASTVVITDMPVILAVSGVVYAMILYEKGVFKHSLICLCVFFAFGMNIKYNMLMFLPPILYWAVKKVRGNGLNVKILSVSLIFVGLAILPYVMNYKNIGNPVWPAFVNLFPGNNPQWDEMAIRNSNDFLAGSRTLWGFMQSFFRLFIMPQHINPLAMITVFFLFFKFKYLDYIPALLVSTYFVILWLMMPDFATSQKERYILYLFPIMIPLGVTKIYDILSSFRSHEKYKRLFEAAVVISILIYSVFTVVYSYDAFGYFVTHDKAKWHRATWYYKDYDWINQNISLDDGDKILVIASAQQTYYLRKPYLNADRLSAAVNWSSLSDLKGIVEMLERNNIKYMFVDDHYLMRYEDANRAIDILRKENVIEIVRESMSKLYFSRINNKFSQIRTVLYEVKPRRATRKNKL